MNVSHVNGVGRVVLSNPNAQKETASEADDASSTAGARAGAGPVSAQAGSKVAAESASAGASSAALVEYDETTNQPIPPRFPWLSRLTRELEPASKQPSPYGSVPILGERLDRTA